MPDKSICIENIQDGYYLDDNNEIKICSISCKTCINSNENCVLCKEDFYKKENGNNECHSKLEENEYLDIIDNLIKKCEERCKTCKEKGSNCLSCNDDKNYFRLERIIPLYKTGKI